MAILAFQKPDKVLMLEADSRFGKFEFRPLEPGFGITVGNALRRILLSSLEGFAITTIKIDGVEHEFSSVPGAKEDVTNIILNLKQVRFKQVVEEFESEKVSITVENSSEFKAGDIGKYLTGFEVLNPELVICHLDSKSTMQIDITINKGRGYVPADENREYCTDVNVIPIDSIYTPIRNVKYQVENFRVEQKTDHLTRFHCIRRNIHNLTVYSNVLVAHQLTSSCASRSNTQTEYDIVKATFQQLEKDFTSNTFSSLSLLKQVAELFFQNAISIFGFLFLTKLNTVFRSLSLSGITVLSGRIVLL